MGVSKVVQGWLDWPWGVVGDDCPDPWDYRPLQPVEEHEAPGTPDRGGVCRPLERHDQLSLPPPGWAPITCFISLNLYPPHCHCLPLISLLTFILLWQSTNCYGLMWCYLIIILLLFNFSMQSFPCSLHISSYKYNAKFSITTSVFSMSSYWFCHISLLA